jgi:predicted AAA+ superfamily ATPase
MNYLSAQLLGCAFSFVDEVFADPAALTRLSSQDTDRADVIRRLCVGGYPEVQKYSDRQRAAWFRDYVRTTIQRDVAELSGIRKLDEMAQLLRLFAARTGGELVMQNVINDGPLERQAVYDHRAWLETIHLIATVPVWSRNLTARIKRHPKLFVTDPGLAAWLLGKTPTALAEPTDSAAGQLVETLVYSELRRQLTWSDTEASIFHWRDREGAEVDLVLEAADGRVIGIEVKTSSSPRAEWFRWLSRMRGAVGDQFTAGITLYTGAQVLPFGDRLYAAPIQSLWQL